MTAEWAYAVCKMTDGMRWTEKEFMAGMMNREA